MNFEEFVLLIFLLIKYSDNYNIRRYKQNSYTIYVQAIVTLKQATVKYSMHVKPSNKVQAVIWGSKNPDSIQLPDSLIFHQPVILPFLYKKTFAKKW